MGGSDNELDGVAAISASNVWAVGSYYGGTAERTLIEHWNGIAWKVIPSPNHGTSSNYLSGVAATSASNVWAVGTYYVSGVNRTLIEHWNGTAWKLLKSPNRGTSDNQLVGVAVTSSSDAWAVGHDVSGSANETLIEHWNGTSWSIKTSPNPAGTSHDNYLTGVAATSATNAWAVGTFNVSGHEQTLIEHWNGSAWAVQPSPDPAGGAAGNDLHAIAATSSTNAWAVGEYWAGAEYVPLALHCC